MLSLHGLGGVGKTALAIGYVDTFANDYDLIAWVEADPVEGIPAQYRQLVRNVTGVDLPEADAVASAKALLASSARWLVVFDNVVSEDQVQPFLLVRKRT